MKDSTTQSQLMKLRLLKWKIAYMPGQYSSPILLSLKDDTCFICFIWLLALLSYIV